MDLGLNRLGIGAKLVGGFGVVLGLMLLMSVVVLVEMTSVSRAVDVSVAQGIRHLVSANNLMTSNKDIAIAVRDVVSLESVSAQKESVKTLRASQKRFREELKAALETEQGADLAQLKTADARFKAIEPMIDEVLTRVDEASFDEAKLFVFTKLRPKQAELSEGVQLYLQAQVEAANAGAIAAKQGVSSARIKLLVIVLVSLFAGILIASRITRGIVGPLQSASALAASVANGDLTERVAAKGQDEISTLMNSLNAMSETLGSTVSTIRVDANATAERAGQLADGTRTASELAEEQAQQVMSVASAMEQMSESIRGVSGSAQGVSEASKKAAELSVDGSTSMTRNLEEMQVIVTQVDDSSRIIVELSDAIAQVSAVTAVIKEISDQTNLLALNAAIEAARAGEMGRGFAVVADEVRKLAERTGQSTAEISTTLAHITSKASETVAAMQQVKETVEVGSKESREVEAKLHLIVAAIGEVSELAREIAVATKEQSNAADSSARSIETISQAFEGTNRTIQAAGLTAAEMNRVAQRLQHAVEKFRINT